jgi:hypothetical protein
MDDDAVVAGEELGLTVVVVTSLLRSGSDSLFRGDGVVVIYLVPPLMSSSSLSSTSLLCRRLFVVSRSEVSFRSRGGTGASVSFPLGEEK